MSVVWEDEYDPSELDGFQVETCEDDQWDAAAEWLSYEDAHERDGSSE